ncbi:MAG: cysteine--tRNA ligase [Patescibacteria group bacterium]
MDIYLHNTLSGKKDIFKPITPGVVSMYNCGPTVYNYAHIGNLRSYIFADTLRRMFEYNGYAVTQVINITDVGHLVSDGDDGEDKMEKGARREGKSAKEVSEFYTQAFFDDLDSLNIPREKIEFPLATEYIQEQIEMIQELENDGYTYKTSDGIYFDTAKFPEYGKLGHINLSGLEEGARIGVNAEKKNVTDFALWKFSPKDTKREMEWESLWGVGFPGWHIECSAMSKSLLGVTFDVHTGGIDHIPVHHNNEIAQSVCANHAPFVHYWMHNAYYKIGGEKMAKSGENFLRIQTLLEKSIHPLAYRYLMLTARYSSPIEFSWEALIGSNTAYHKLKHALHNTNPQSDSTSNNTDLISIYRTKFTEHINDDLDTPRAIALVWEIMKNDLIPLHQKREIIYEFDTVLGLNLDKIVEEQVIPEEVLELVELRSKAREEKDFERSDELRQQIEEMGYVVTDEANDTFVSHK